MRRFLRSLIPGLVIGTLIGLYLGWVEFPQEAYRSDMSEMAPSFRDDYLIMIAAGLPWMGISRAQLSVCIRLVSLMSLAMCSIRPSG